MRIVEMTNGSGGQETFFDERFLGRYAGAIMNDPTTALVELVANAWDAYATRVDIQWPDKKNNIAFRITDNGIGMTAEEFEMRWRTLDYNRVTHQGNTVLPPEGTSGNPRVVYGRNGKGRHAAFYFSSPYFIKSWKNGRENSYTVSQGRTNPIDIKHTQESREALGHGTEIVALSTNNSSFGAAEIRSVLSTRFLANPAFEVFCRRSEGYI